MNESNQDTPNPPASLSFVPPTSIGSDSARKKQLKRRPQPQLRALEGALPVADWASLFGDLSRNPAQAANVDNPIEWRIHDKTHLEFAIDYPISSTEKTYEWEAYFFVPESFRLAQDTYDKKEIYDDLLSYVRLAVPTIPFHDLARDDEPSIVGKLRGTLLQCHNVQDDAAIVLAASHQLRLYACLVRASGVVALRDLEQQLSDFSFDFTTLQRYIRTFTSTCSAVTLTWRGIMREALREDTPDLVRETARWVDEDISLHIETLCASLGLSIRRRRGDHSPMLELAEHVAACAVAEARHRMRQGYDSVGNAEASTRRVEHLEFRRHVLKRFISSTLWLSLEVRNAGEWALQLLYALAAGCAMAFALLANRQADQTSNLYRYMILVILAYAIKDRMKAFLQNAFQGLIAKRFADRKWLIREPRSSKELGYVRERAGFRYMHQVPVGVMSARRLTREHPLEEDARRERILWHEKTVTITPEANQLGDPAFPMLTEIFRLNLARWLSHTDDPNRKIVFADPNDARIYTATARRVYNISVVYRLQHQDQDAPWHRLRVVVSRKGIERIDSIC